MSNQMKSAFGIAFAVAALLTAKDLFSSNQQTDQVNGNKISDPLNNVPVGPTIKFLIW